MFTQHRNPTHLGTVFYKKTRMRSCVNAGAPVSKPCSCDIVERTDAMDPVLRNRR